MTRTEINPTDDPSIRRLQCEAHIDGFTLMRCPERADWLVDGVTNRRRLSCDIHLSHLCGEGTSMVTMLMDCCQCEACLQDGPHASDCAVHNEPAYPNGPCSCGPTP